MRIALCLVVFLIVGCEQRAQRVDVSNPPPRFTACVIDTHYADDREQLVAALGPYYDLVTLPEVRVKGIADQTLVCVMDGSPGFWGSKVHIALDRFGKGREGRLEYIDIHRGFLYGGRSAAFHEALVLLDPEAAAFSAKLHPADAPPSQPTADPARPRGLER